MAPLGVLLITSHTWVPEDAINLSICGCFFHDGLNIHTQQVMGQFIQQGMVQAFPQKSECKTQPTTGSAWSGEVILQLGHWIHCMHIAPCIRPYSFMY